METKPIFKRMREQIKENMDFTPVEPVPCIKQLISDLLNSGFLIHLAHLNTKNHEVHMALDTYYKGLPELVDVLAEAAIGMEDDVVIPYHSPVKYYTEHMEIISEVYNKCVAVHGTLPPVLSNPLEDIMTFIAQTMYRLQLK